MGFFSKVFQKLASKPELVKQSVELAGFRELVEEKVSSAVASDIKKAKTIAEQIYTSFESLSQDIDLLETAEPNARQYPEKIVNMSLSSRDLFCKVAKSTILRLKQPETDNIEQFHTDAVASLRSLNPNPKQTELLMFFFERKLKPISVGLNQIHQSTSKLANYFNDSSTLQKRRRLEQDLELALASKVEIDAANKAVASAKETSEKLSGQIDKLDFELVDVNKCAAALDTDRTAVTAMQKFESELASRFRALEKPLKKFSHIDVIHASLLSRYVDSFTKGMLADEECKLLELLPRFRKLVEDGEVKLDAKCKARTLSALDKLNKDLFVSTKSAHNKLKGELEAAEQARTAALAPLEDRKKRVDGELAELKGELASIEIDVRAKSRFVERKEKELAEAKSRLEKLASEFIGGSIRIVG